MTSEGERRGGGPLTVASHLCCPYVCCMCSLMGLFAHLSDSMMNYKLPSRISPNVLMALVKDACTTGALFQLLSLSVCIDRLGRSYSMMHAEQRREGEGVGEGVGRTDLPLNTNYECDLAKSPLRIRFHFKRVACTHPE